MFRFRNTSELDVRPWFRSDMVHILNALLLSVALWPEERRNGALAVLVLAAQQFGLRSDEVERELNNVNSN